jgi:metal-responsive CopG/Arc/MetJ family transcriptional regulator
MLKQQKTHQNITISLPQKIVKDLHLFVKKRGISKFIEEAVTEKLEAKKSIKEQQYIDAANDQERNQIFQEWDALASDGINEQNEW